MYGKRDQSLIQRWFIFILQCAFLVFAYWFLFLGGNKFFELPLGDYHRRIMLFVFCIVIFIRMNFMIFYLLKRGITWGEALNVPLAFAIYYIGFSMLGGVIDKHLDFIDFIAVFIFLVGSFINTFSEVLRNQWKKDSRHRGKLYTEGLFKYSVHINYFGDWVWVSGFALLTRNIWSWIIPLILFLFFVFYNIPQHDKYLRQKYGETFKQYEKSTKRFIPFIF
ncbi:methyltransferase family protein [Pseudalkalibacillus sp. A8]|uniref:methyltransferase family protein n=1 Tax=Pseudalkalibacillus sp. A8 TaxID=3382641 RepID=UPI0038B67932